MTAQKEPIYGTTEKPHPFSCGSCKVKGCSLNYATENKVPAKLKNLRWDILNIVGCATNLRSRPLPAPAPEQNEVAISELVSFDYWFAGRHVCGQSPIIPEVRQEIHRRITELRKVKPE